MLKNSFNLKHDWFLFMSKLCFFTSLFIFTILIKNTFANLSVNNLDSFITNNCKNNDDNDREWLLHKVGAVKNCANSKAYSRIITEEKSLINIIEKFKKICPNIHKEHIIFENILEYYRGKAVENQINFLLSELERISEFRSPQYEISQIKKHLSSRFYKNKINPLTGKEKYLEDLLKKGLQNSEKRRKSCTTVNNLKPPLVSEQDRNNYKTRDQGSSGWCFAYTAADLLSFHIGKDISARDIANSYYKGSTISGIKELFGTKRSSHREGLINVAVQRALEHGLCLEEQLPSSDFEFTADKNFSDTLNSLEQLKIDLSGSTLLDKQNFCTEEFYKDFSELFPSFSKQDLISIITKSSNNVSLMENLIEKQCTPRNNVWLNKLEITSTKCLSDSSCKNMLDLVDQELSNENIIGLGYNATILETINVEGRLENMHASSIVGRKFNEFTGSCEYLIRNSQGTGCTQSPFFQCKQGHIYIPEEYLIKAMFEIDYIKKK
ncbi:MAG: hypothetical protein HQK51_18115 [Oligoflexia bacterium]|nr:hypothetical protein [Oligoflexia bacterium]